MYSLSKTSKANLVGVHPDLVRVVEFAITITNVDFGVSKSVRTKEEHAQYLAEGKSTTMNSMHIPQDDGYSHAVDLYAYVDGKATYELQYFRRIIQAMVTAAIHLHVQITIGALWRTFVDSPHFELRQRPVR